MHYLYPHKVGVYVHVPGGQHPGLLSLLHQITPSESCSIVKKTVPWARQLSQINNV